MKQLYFIGLFSLLTFHACTSTKKEVKHAAVNYFNNCKHKDFRDIDHRYLSAELSLLIQQSIEREKIEIEKVGESDYPTDKPFIMEGDLFSSIYEGPDSMCILSVQINADTAIVDIMFYCTESRNRFNWNDCLILVNEKGWKVDNIIFKSEYTQEKTTKDVLREYIQTDNQIPSDKQETNTKTADN